MASHENNYSEQITSTTPFPLSQELLDPKTFRLSCNNTEAAGQSAAVASEPTLPTSARITDSQYGHTVATERLCEGGRGEKENSRISMTNIKVEETGPSSVKAERSFTVKVEGDKEGSVEAQYHKDIKAENDDVVKNSPPFPSNVEPKSEGKSEGPRDEGLGIEGPGDEGLGDEGGQEKVDVDDDIFKSFMSDVKSLPTTETAPPKPTGLLRGSQENEDDKISKLLSRYEVDSIEVDWKTSEEQVDRILNCLKSGSSHFDVLLLPPYASKELIKKHFRKLSVLIHPDKCSHAESQTAFMAVKKSFEELQKPEYRAKYVDVIEEAKEQILKERKKAGKAKETINMDDEALRKETIQRCDQILKEREERIAYAERTRLENELRLQRMQAEQDAEEYRKQLERNKWLEKRDERVCNWRDFREHVVSKRMRTEAGDKRVVAGVKAGGLDETYKKNWR